MMSTMHCIQLRLTRLTILINPVNTPHVFMEQSRDYDLFVREKKTRYGRVGELLENNICFQPFLQVEAKGSKLPIHRRVTRTTPFFMMFEAAVGFELFFCSECVFASIATH